MKKIFPISLLCFSVLLSSCGSQTPNTPASNKADSSTVSTTAKSSSLNNTADPAIQESTGIRPLSFYKQTEYDSLNSDDLNLSDNNYYTLAQMKTEGIMLIDNHSDALQDSLYAEAASALLEQNNYKSNALESIKDMLEYTDSIENMLYGPWEYSDTIDIKRADSSILSFCRVNSSYLGGAHPNTVYISRNYDSDTGAELNIKDIISDYDSLYNITEEILNDYEYKDEFFPDWKDTLHSCFYGSDDYPASLTWLVTDKGIQLIFNAYDLGPYAMGPVFTDIEYDAHPELFNSKYCYTNDYLPVYDMLSQSDWSDFGRTLYLDFDRDGTDDMLCVNENMTEEDTEYDTYKNISVALGRDKSTLKTVTFEGGYSIRGIDIMSNDNNKFFLYITTNFENDLEETYIYDISDCEAGPVFIDTNHTGSLCSIEPLNQNNIIIQTRINILGTYSGIMRCQVSDDGQLIPYEDNTDYYICSSNTDIAGNKYSYDEDFNEKMFVLQDFTAYSDSSFTTSITVAAGTVIAPYKSDNNLYMCFKTSNGELIYVKYDEDSIEQWPHTIGDIEEDQIISNIRYAG